MDANYPLRSIGIVRTNYSERYEAPSQPGRVPGEEDAQVVLHAGEDFEQALLDLKGFEKIWLLTWLDRNVNWKPMVRPPRGSKQKRGVFATRSPHRPNPIGLTLTDLKGIEGRTLKVGPVDLLDGTPILDLKPYLPFVEAFPDARAGWIEEALAEGTEQPYTVVWNELAAEQDRFLKKGFGVDLKLLSERVLRHDPHPHPYRRVSALADGSRQLALKSWRLIFSLQDVEVHIKYIQSGYELERLKRAEAEEVLHDYHAHLGFHQCWPQT